VDGIPLSTPADTAARMTARAIGVIGEGQRTVKARAAEGL
jgi:hypothetical protein